jgi:RNA polymerase sigma-70 factor (ECF subfamily)
MEASERQHVDEELRRLCEAGNCKGAVALALESYGLEFHKLLMIILKHRDWADDAFSAFSESLLKSLPGFRWESSFRTWAYRVARHTCAQYLRSLHGREKWASDGALADQPHRERSMTQPWLRTDIKRRFRELQDKLSPHERKILALRVEGGLSWNEVARVMAGQDLATDDLRQRVVVLRQQYQRIKVRLRELAIEESLISSELS